MSTHHHIELAIEGMTCNSCAMRIERKLNDLDGVTATVNYATERAAVAFDPDTMTPPQLLSTVADTGYRAIELGDNNADGAPNNQPVPPTDELRHRLVISALLGLPVLAMAMTPALQFDNWQWASLTLGAPVVVWGGWPFHKAALTNLRHRAVTMDTLVSVGTIAAFTWSLWALFAGDAGHSGMKMPWSFDLQRGNGAGHIYLEVASVVIVFLLAGRYFEARAKRRAGAAIEALSDLGAKDVGTLDINGAERRIPIEDLHVGMRFVVRPGEKVATDGSIVSGTSSIDMSTITGESLPIDVAPGDTVTGGTINTNGRLIVRATQVGAETTLAAMKRLLEAAQSGKAPVQRLADRVSTVFVPSVIAIAIATLVFWLVDGAGATFAFGAMVAVLIVACPCALGLATPTALLVGTGRAARFGILIRGPEVLENTRRIDTVVLDKTGTITTGTMSVQSVVPDTTTSEGEVLRFAAAIEQASDHPIARAIVNAHETSTPLPTIDAFVDHAGFGVSGTVEGHSVIVGKPKFLHDSGVVFDDRLSSTVDQRTAAGFTVVAVAWDKTARGIIAVSDSPKPHGREAIESLHALGLQTVLLSGDNRAAADRIAEVVGISTVIAEVLPDQKLATIQRLQREGRIVAMVGDGVNDAAALARADLGIAMGTGTDVAIAASDLTVIGDDLRAVPNAIVLAQHTLSTIKTNLFWAFAYNVAAIPLAAAGFLDPLIAGAAMALSSVFVVSNSLRLRHYTPDPLGDRKHRKMKLVATVALTAGVLVAAVSAAIIGLTGTDNDDVVADHNAQDVSFVRDMIPHHVQAVEMARLVPIRSDDIRIESIAQRIESAQQPEIDTMNKWLEQWGEPLVDATAPDSGHAGHGPSMTGMMTAGDMNAVAGASGAAFDRMFVEMMIEHHRGAIAMAETEMADGKSSEAKRLATSIVREQQAEIDEMKSFLP